MSIIGGATQNLIARAGHAVTVGRSSGESQTNESRSAFSCTLRSKIAGKRFREPVPAGRGKLQCTISVPICNHLACLSIWERESELIHPFNRYYVVSWNLYSSASSIIQQ